MATDEARDELARLMQRSDIQVRALKRERRGLFDTVREFIPMLQDLDDGHKLGSCKRFNVDADLPEPAGQALGAPSESRTVRMEDYPFY